MSIWNLSQPTGFHGRIMDTYSCNVTVVLKQQASSIYENKVCFAQCAVAPASMRESGVLYGRRSTSQHSQARMIRRSNLKKIILPPKSTKAHLPARPATASASSIIARTCDSRIPMYIWACTARIQRTVTLMIPVS
jgi:hypothetical protein